MLAYASGWLILYTQRKIRLPCCARMKSQSQIYKSKIGFHWNLSMKYENIFTTRSITETVRHYARFDWWKTWRQTQEAGLPPPGRARRTKSTRNIIYPLKLMQICKTHPFHETCLSGNSATLEIKKTYKTKTKKHWKTSTNYAPST